MIYDWAREQAEINGNQIAVSLYDEKMTYGQLEAESNKLAGLLIKQNLKPGDRVGLFLEKTPKTIIAMLGISKAGGVYVPLDPHSPAERLIKIIKSSELSLIFIDQETTLHFQNIIHSDPETGLIPWAWWSAVTLMYGDDFPPQFIYKDIESQKNEPHQIIRNSARAAHILFTSGSTGQPKPVRGTLLAAVGLVVLLPSALPQMYQLQLPWICYLAPLLYSLFSFFSCKNSCKLNILPPAYIFENEINLLMCVIYKRYTYQ